MPKTLYTDAALKIIIDGYIESKKLYRYKKEDRPKVRELKEKIIAGVAKIGKFSSKLKWNPIHQRVSVLTQDDITRLGYGEMKLPLQFTNLISAKTDGNKKDKHEFVLEERSWDDPIVLEIDKAKWERPGIRIGGVSGIAFANQGYRAGLIGAGAKILANDATHFNIINGHLIDGKAFKSQVADQTQGLKSEEKAEAIEQLIDEAAKALAALLPKIKKPRDADNVKKDEYVEWYIVPSSPYDGEYGDKIIQALSTLRPDIRKFKAGGAWLEIKHINPALGIKILGVLNPIKNRMPTKYFSTVAEREIDDKERQSSHNYPYMWMVGPFASGVFTPDGIRPRPYITLPALRRLEESRSAENQVGVVILKCRQDDAQPSIQVWSLRDLIKKERSFINAPRNANENQKKIIDILKEHDAQTSGLIADKFPALSREKIEKELTALTSDEMSKLKTWPGIHYNPSSREYDFHLEWMQRKLSYPLPNDFKEDRMLFFGCLHAGYTTTDYAHFIQKYPQIILQKKIQHLFGLGDFSAGLHHNFGHTGEVFGSLNYTEQEYFAGELVATVIFKVFLERFEKKIKTIKNKMSSEELESIVRESLIKFYFIAGNHDLWQEGEGHTPLEIFYLRLISLLNAHIGRALREKNLPFIDLSNIIRSHIGYFPDYEASCVLPSGIKVSMQHPHMGRTQTTSLRAQSAIGYLSCQIAAIANFHAATVVPMWRPDLGQCVAVQVGTQVIYTRFERRKMKGNDKTVDFGPIFLRVLSHEGHIWMHEASAYNKPILKEPISKSTDPRVLKKDLGLLTM